MANSAPIWVNVRHDDTCKCGRALRGGEDRGQYDMEAQEFVACETCSPDMVETSPARTDDRLSEPNTISALIDAIEAFALANGCEDKADKMLAAVLRAAR